MTITASAADAPVVMDARVTYNQPTQWTTYQVTSGPRLRISTARGGEGWLVVDQVTGIHGVGAEFSEAIKDFATALREHLDVLEHEADLSDDLARQLDYLRERV